MDLFVSLPGHARAHIADSTLSFQNALIGSSLRGWACDETVLKQPLLAAASRVGGSAANIIRAGVIELMQAGGIHVPARRRCRRSSSGIIGEPSLEQQLITFRAALENALVSVCVGMMSRCFSLKLSGARPHQRRLDHSFRVGL